MHTNTHAHSHAHAHAHTHTHTQTHHRIDHVHVQFFAVDNIFSFDALKSEDDVLKNILLFHFGRIFSSAQRYNTI